ncbi:MAG TPA: class I SAM-dependent methyltransferase [Pseudonocardia sp.]|jgi:SAM-dependent methyltransferase
MLSEDQKSFRARGRTFGTVALAYAAHRPNYPDSAVGWALGPGTRREHVLDLAAGTGKLTASLVARAGRVSAVEPDPEMLAVLHEQLPTVHALAGSAEHIPLPDASVDAVLVGQAFHWFDPDAAGLEIGRVLRPGGVLAALWNYDDNSVGWVDGYHGAASEDRRVPGVPTGPDRADLPRLDLFAPAERAEFEHSRRLTVDGLIEVLATHSWALVSSEAERTEVYRRVRDYFAGRPELFAEDGSFELPMRTFVARSARLADRLIERR